MVTSVGGVMVSIDAFQALDPGSIPGHRTLLFLFAVISSLILNQKLVIRPESSKARVYFASFVTNFKYFSKTKKLTI